MGRTFEPLAVSKGAWRGCPINNVEMLASDNDCAAQLHVEGRQNVTLGRKTRFAVGTLEMLLIDRIIAQIV